MAVEEKDFVPVVGEPMQVEDLVTKFAKEKGIPENILHALVEHESGYKPWAKNPDSTAGGLGQIIKGTWKGLRPGVDPVMRFNPKENLDAITDMLGQNFKETGSWDSALQRHYGHKDPAENVKFARNILTKAERKRGEELDFVPVQEVGAVTAVGSVEAPPEEKDFVPVAPPSKEDAKRIAAEAEAKRQAIEGVAGLKRGVYQTEPETSLLDPSLLVGGLGSIGLKAGAKAVARALPGYVTGEAAGLGAKEAIGEKEHPYLANLAQMAADIGTGLGTDRMLRRGGQLAKAAGMKEGPSPATTADLVKALKTGTPEEAAQAIQKYMKEGPVVAKEVAPFVPKRAAIELAGEATKVPGTGFQYPDLTPHADTINTVASNLPAKKWDIKEEQLGKFGVETKTFMFDRLDRLSPGLKDSVYGTQKRLEADALRAYRGIEEESRLLEKGLPSHAGERIHTYAVAQQEGGPEILARMGKEVPQLTGEERGAYEWMTGQYNKFFQQLNDSRVLAGLEPFEPVKNYFTFARNYMKVVDAGINPINKAIPADFFNPNSPSFVFFEERVKSNIPLILDSFKVFRRYAKSATNWIYQAPHQAAVQKLADDIGGAAPVAKEALRQWVRNIHGFREESISGIMDPKVSKLVNNYGVSMLSGYVRSALIQPTSLLWTSVATGFGNTMKGITQAMSPKMWDYAKQKSNVLMTREFDVDVKQAMETLMGQRPLEQVRRAVVKTGYKPLHFLDEFSAVSTWLAANSKGKKLGLEGDKLIAYADDMVTKTQGSAARSDVAQIQTHTLGRAASLFQTFIINEWNFLTKDVLGINNPNIKNPEMFKRVARMVAGAVAINTFLEDVVGMPSPVPSPIRAAARSAERGEPVGRQMLEAGKELAGLVPVVGGAFRMGGSPLGPVASLGQDITKMFSQKEQSSISPYGLPFRLAGVPGVTQVERLLQSELVGADKYSVLEALTGKRPVEKPKSLSHGPGLSMRKRQRNPLRETFPIQDWEELF